MYEYELEAELEGEWEGEWESEFEGELEAEYEGEEFFRSLVGLARRGLQSPLLRRAGAVAARAARTLRPVGARLRPAIRRAGLDLARTGLGRMGDIGGAIGGAPGTPGSQLGSRVGGALGDFLGSFLPDSEFEGEWEFEGEMNPLRRVYPDALMEHLGHAATETESEEEAEAFVGALIPLAARVIPRIAPAVMRAAPQLIRGVANVTRVLRSNPATRQLVRTVPNIVRRTAASLAQQSSQGRPVTPARAVRTLARQTARVISNPQRCAQAVQRSRALDRQHHRRVGPAASAVTPRAAAAVARRSGNCSSCL
jgi:hypothetical protein